MDDGTATKYGLKISTNSFSYTDVQFLCEVLQTKYNIKATPNKSEGQWVLYIHSQSINILRDLVKSYFVSSMLNKRSFDIVYPFLYGATYIRYFCGATRSLLSSSKLLPRKATRVKLKVKLQPFLALTTDIPLNIDTRGEEWKGYMLL